MTDIPDGEKALRFVSGVDIAGLPHARRFLAEPPPAFPVLPDKDQSILVGSQIVSFSKGVTPEKRTAIANSALLPQLAANKLIQDQTNVGEWYDKYFDVLTNLGWVLQSKGFTRYVTSDIDADVSEAVLRLAATALGGVASTGYLLVKSALESLRPSEDKKPWVTLFERESLHATASRFQVSLVNEDPNGGFLITMMAFSLEAKSTLTQVLFFKFRSDSVNFEQLSGAVTISDTLLDTISAKVAARVTMYASSYIQELPDLS